MNINVIAGRPAKRSSVSKQIQVRRILLRRILARRISAAAMLVLSWSAPGLAETPGRAEQKPAFKALDVFDLQWAADPQVSPDGRSIAYVRMGYDIKTDRARGTIWLVGVDGKNERPLSGAPTS